ncbi:RecQ family ATP-dependent DNA helicase [Pisciglobus halotolerans]|uniref:ATP-dependent DNA helicase RecQ n=1 Tax=Pisciglobus halotolerans TaxID=745365 RepID=A0A1I3CH46_9LACT|nr:ATP-dependent DNA helicase RecQ [Pisciglobus halotolerans]SFH73808.1 ATP-dependent DNA helicase RecQ [Pisciglobus halotolerans]
MYREEQLKKLLQVKFGYPEFREGQQEAIEAALNGDHTLVMLPTGTGKSICYQLSGYCLEGKVLVISPLLSLMQDQVEQMKQKGEKRVVALNSLLSNEEKKYLLDHLSIYKFIYLSPEMLQQEKVMRALKKQNIALFVVDEAHCISQWGMDFRLDYLHLGWARKQLGSPLTMALTATATKRVRKEILSSLDLEKEPFQEIVYSVDRPNIVLDVIHCDQNKDEQVLEKVAFLEPPGIIYFSSKAAADEMAEKINQQTSFYAESYHSDIDSADKIKIQQQFIRDDIDIICATSAFGMGINKNNIRYVLHYHLPASPEDYLQEIGRAGRDGKKSIAVLFYESGDYAIQKYFQDESLPTRKMIDWAYRKQNMQLLDANEIQKRMAAYFVDQHIDQQTAYQTVMERKRIKEEQLSYMIQYSETKDCKRAFLLHYFGERAMETTENCCSSCSIDWTDFEKTMKTKEKKAKEVTKNWQKSFNALFLFSYF